MLPAEMGERALVRRLARVFAASGGRNVLGLADDAAAIPLGGEFLVASLDTFARPTHFPAAMSFAQMGRMAAGAAMSDLAAKGAMPLGLLLGLGVPPDLESEALEEVARGFAAMADAAGAEVLGGDTKPAAHLTLTVAALGTVPEGQLMPRAGVRPGDLLAVTGELGGAAAGLAALQRGKPHLAQRLLEPAPRLAEGRALAASGAARACMDLSDGLAASLHQWAALHRGGFAVEVDALPLHAAAHAAARSPTEPWDWALQGGGDYELLAALRPGEAERARAAVAAAGGTLTVVGRALAEPGVWMERHGKREPLPDEGWDGFAPRT